MWMDQVAGAALYNMAAWSQAVVQTTAYWSIGRADRRRLEPVRALRQAFSQFGCSWRPGTKKSAPTLADLGCGYRCLLQSRLSVVISLASNLCFSTICSKTA